ncbi:MAG: hypothetical protein HN738_15480 [Gammaproteobacteria bacterium]|nr:hypothetical protein [Gammaproteobacteria bacterium]MBT5683605.1 hypothetical protein [Gammaproteobacteria bacterium]MBT7879477.1 hypothetical protein [Gammaproteobacteria bacterium]
MLKIIVLNLGLLSTGLSIEKIAASGRHVVFSFNQSAAERREDMGQAFLVQRRSKYELAEVSSG